MLQTVLVDKALVEIIVIMITLLRYPRRFPEGKSNLQSVQQIEAVTIVNIEYLCYFGIHLQLCPSLALQNHRLASPWTTYQVGCEDNFHSDHPDQLKLNCYS